MKTPIGVEDFKELISGEFYVDKTLMIRTIIGSRVSLFAFPRPRRFGKTLCLSMIDNYFNVTMDSKKLFSNLNISKCGDKYLSEMNKYPVIHLSFKNLKSSNFEGMLKNIHNLMRMEYKKHNYIYEGLKDHEKRHYDLITNKNCDYVDCELSLHYLTMLLSKFYNKKVIVLIDEYDAIMQEAYLNDYLKDANRFINGFLGEALKTNEYLKFGVLTGVLETTNECIHGSLNNAAVFSCSKKIFSEFFGFTHEEVMNALEQAKLTHLKDDVESWYGGYEIFDRKLYNPWSINNFLNNDGILKPYWVNTGKTEIIASMLKDEVIEDLQKLLNGESVLCHLAEDVVYSLKHKNAIFLLNFCYMAGYLTIKNSKEGYAYFKIPNHEVKIAFEVVIKSFVKKYTLSNDLKMLHTSIISNDKSLLEKTLNSILISYINFHGYIGYFPHALCLALYVSFGHDYIVKSNRESGYGRYDALLYKKDLSFGCVIEFNIANENDDLEEKIKEVSLQIKEKKYIEELEDLGIKNIYTYSTLFNKKECIVR